MQSDHTTQGDRELSHEEVIRLAAGYACRVTIATRAGGDAPNEDAYALASDGRSLIIAVFDGTSSQRPIAALGATTGAYFAAHFLAEQTRLHGAGRLPHDLLLDLNRRLFAAARALGGSLADTHSLPAATATIAQIDPGAGLLRFAHLGDSYLLVAYPRQTERLTDDRNRAFDEAMFALMRAIAAERGITIRQARDDPRVAAALVEMFTRRNNAPDGSGSGLLNGDPNAALYIQTGAVPLRDIQAVLLGSDGLLPQGWSLDVAADRARLIALAREPGLSGVIAAKLASEASDPHWQHPRYKQSDDATGILVVPLP